MKHGLVHVGASQRVSLLLMLARLGAAEPREPLAPGARIVCMHASVQISRPTPLRNIKPAADSQLAFKVAGKWLAP